MHATYIHTLKILSDKNVGPTWNAVYGYDQVKILGHLQILIYYKSYTLDLILYLEEIQYMFNIVHI